MAEPLGALTSPSGEHRGHGGTTTTTTTSSGGGTTTYPGTPAAAEPRRKGWASDTAIGGTYATVEAAPICNTIDEYEEFVRYWQAKDEGALQQLMADDACLLAKGNVKLIVEERISHSRAIVRVPKTRKQPVLDPTIALKDWGDK